MLFSNNMSLLIARVFDIITIFLMFA